MRKVTYLDELYARWFDELRTMGTFEITRKSLRIGGRALKVAEQLEDIQSQAEIMAERKRLADEAIERHRSQRKTDTFATNYGV